MWLQVEPVWEGCQLDCNDCKQIGALMQRLVKTTRDAGRRPDGHSRPNGAPEMQRLI